MPSSTSTVRGGGTKSSKKSKKSKKKEDNGDEEPEVDPMQENEAEFQRVLLEIRVNELESLNAGLKKKLEYLETQNSVYKTQLEELKLEKQELVAYLEKSWKEEKVLVKQMEDRLIAVHQQLVIDRKNYEQQLVTRKLEHEEMKSKFELQIEDMGRNLESYELQSPRLGIRLRAIDDFRQQKEDLKKQFQNQEKNLEELKISHKLKYENLENDFIGFREKLKKEATLSVMEISKKVQEAGRKCLSGAARTAIIANVKLREELEIVSSDNLNLRDRFDEYNFQVKKLKSIIQKLEMKIRKEFQRAEQYKNLIELVLDKEDEKTYLIN